MLTAVGCASAPESRGLTEYTISPEAERVLRAHEERFRDCYRHHAGQRQPRPRGVVMVFFRLSPEGRVLNAAVRDTSLMDPATEVCVVRELKRLEFPKPTHPSSQELTYPVKFSGYE